MPIGGKIVTRSRFLRSTALAGGFNAIVLGLVVAVPVTALCASGVAAQDATLASAPSSSSSTDGAGQGGEIIVTGSRIARPQVESSVPVAVVTAQSIQDAGQTNLLEALRDLPISGQSADRSASNFLTSGNGQATVNLRNLASSRTLVLINGRRSVGVPGSSAVDLNNIPVDLIDHVEIATGGASAVYGSDAIAGVVNIILKRNFSGLQVHVENMINSRGDGETPLASVLAGKNFTGGRGNVTANVSYTKAGRVASSDRAYSRDDSPSGSAYTPDGAFLLQDKAGTAFTFDKNGNVVPDAFTSDQRYNRAADRLLAVPVERYSAALLAHYDFSPAAQLYGEFLYNRTKAVGQLEPLAADDSGTQGESVLNFDGSAFPGISINNPYTPEAIRAAATAATGPDSLLDFYKRSNGLFDRSPHDSRDYYRGVIGLKGDIGSKWSYDLSYEHSQVRDDTANQAILMTNYGASLQATTIGGMVVCADPVARAAGCVPINPFGAPNYTAAQIKWLETYTGQGVTVPGATPGEQVTADLLQKNYQDVASLSITGPLFDLPNGPLGVALGGEYHREKISAIYDPFTQSGYSSQQLSGNEVGRYNSKEAFVELNAPIFGRHPFVYELSLEAAARYSDYSTVGSVWSYKYGGTYAPTPDIRFRSVYARAVRAPNLNELYSPKSNTAQTIVDPCDQGEGIGGAALIALPAGCSALPGIANYLTSHQNFVYSLQQVQTIFGYAGGNPNLKQETTSTFTAGATLTPRFLHNFVLTADYYSIKVKHAISTIDPQISVTQCFNGGDPEFCSLVHRNDNGFITEVDQVNINAASYQVAGIDVQALYNLKTHFFGGDGERLDVNLFYNHKFKQQQTPFAGSPISNELGKADSYNSQQLGTGFKNQFTFNLNYDIGAMSLHYRLKYLGPVSAAFGTTAIPIPAYTYSDLQVKFDVAKSIEFYLGVNNLLDKQPPFIVGGSNQWPGTNTVADTYDLLGRVFYAGAVVKL
jgi:outer membrane receptor protein involved in Fe transport